MGWVLWPSLRDRVSYRVRVMYSWSRSRRAFFVSDEVYIESRVMCIFVGILGLEVWDRG
jgi:hypothetical protein